MECFKSPLPSGRPRKAVLWQFSPGSGWIFQHPRGADIRRFQLSDCSGGMTSNFPWIYPPTLVTLRNTGCLWGSPTEDAKHPAVPGILGAGGRSKCFLFVKQAAWACLRISITSLTMGRCECKDCRCAGEEFCSKDWDTKQHWDAEKSVIIGVRVYHGIS